jgi:hypothetical protein
MAWSTVAGGDLLDAYLHATGPFPTYSALGKIEIDPANALFMLLLLQGVLGWVLGAFSFGVLAHMVLYREGVWPACRAASRRMPALLVVILLYSTLMGFGAAGINAGLRNAGFDLSNAGQGAITPQGILTKTMMHAIDQAIPSTGSPVVEFVPFLRHKAFRNWDVTPDYSSKLPLTYGIPSEMPVQPRDDDPSRHVWHATMAGAVAILLAQLLLCFGAPAAISIGGMSAPVLRSAGWGIRYCLPIILSRSAVFGLIAGIKILFVVMPLVLMQCLIRPQQWLPNGLGVNTDALCMMTICIVDAVFCGYIVVHAATLFAHLT